VPAESGNYLPALRYQDAVEESAIRTLINQLPRAGVISRTDLPKFQMMPEGYQSKRHDYPGATNPNHGLVIKAPLLQRSVSWRCNRDSVPPFCYSCSKLAHTFADYYSGNVVMTIVLIPKSLSH